MFKKLISILILLIITVVTLSPTSGAVREPVETFDNLAKIYGEQYLYNKDSYAWGESYNMMAFATMYEATKDVKYLRTLNRHIRIVFSKRDDIMKQKDYRGILMPAWGSMNYTNGKHYVWTVHTGMITYPIAKFVRLVYEDKALWNEFKEDADNYLELVIESTLAHEPDFLDGPGEDEGYYTYGKDYRDLGIIYENLPLNQQNAIGRTFVELYRITGEEKYLERVRKLARFTKNRLFLLPNEAYAWMYWMDPRFEYNGPIEIDAEAQERLANSAEDISHGAITVDFAVEAHRIGAVFDSIDMQRFSNALLNNIITENYMVSMRVAGGGGFDVPGYAEQLGRWGELAQYDIKVLEKLETLYNTKILYIPLVVQAKFVKGNLCWKER